MTSTALKIPRHDHYWALRPENHKTVIDFLKRSLMASDISWDDSRKAYKIGYDRWQYHYKIADPKKRGTYLQHPTGRTLTTADLDMQMLVKICSQTGNPNEVILPGSVKTMEVNFGVGKKPEQLPTEFLLNLEYITQDQMQTLQREGEAQRKANGLYSSRGY